MRRCFHCTGGTIFIETALILPILVTLVFGAFEMGNLYLVNQKVNQVVAAITSLIAEADRISASDLQNYQSAVNVMLDRQDATVQMDIEYWEDSGAGLTRAWQNNTKGASFTNDTKKFFQTFGDTGIDRIARLRMRISIPRVGTGYFIKDQQYYKEEIIQPSLLLKYSGGRG